MKRDNDYLRELLLDIEGRDDWLFFVSKAVRGDSDSRKLWHHADLMCDAGLMIQVSSNGYRMTNQGYDYLETIRDQGIWRRTKEAVAQSGGNATLQIIKDLANGYVRKQVSDRTGIDL